MKRQEIEDYELIKGCFSGNTEAYGMVVQKYHPYVCGLTFSALGNLEKSEELAQEVFVIVWNNLAKLNDYTKFKSWLYRITKNHINHFFNNKKRDILSSSKQLVEAQSICTVQDNPERNTLSKERQQMVWQILSEIKIQHRDILILYYWKGKSAKEVAQFYDITEVAAKKRVSRARNMVRENVESDFEKTVVTAFPKDRFTASVIALVAAGTMIPSGTVSAASAASAGPIITNGHGIFSFLFGGIKAKIITSISIVAFTMSTVTIISQQKQTPTIPENVTQTLPAKINQDMALYLSFDKIKKDENGNIELVDQSGNTNNGFLFGGEFVDGIAGKCLSLNKKNGNEGVLVRDNPSLDLDRVTIAIWIKTNQLDDKWNRILNKDWRTAYSLFIVGSDNGQKRLQRPPAFASFECVKQITATKTKIIDNQWHFIVGTYDGRTMCLYVDGKLERTKNTNKTILMEHNDLDLRIGLPPDNEPLDANHGCYRGLIDEVRVYNRAISPEEVQQLYYYRPDSVNDNIQ